MTAPVPRQTPLVVVPERHVFDDSVPPTQRRRRRARRAQPVLPPPSGLSKRLIFGLSMVAVLVLGLGGWAAVAELSAAVVAPGQLVVDSNVKKIQHQAGGVVGTIHVRNGDEVAAGTVLLTLDDVQARAIAAIQTAKVVQLHSERARLAAERDGAPEMVFPALLDPTDEQAKTAFAAERRLMAARRNGWTSQKARLAERVAQTRNEIAAVQSQREAKQREIDLIRQELTIVEDLHKQKLANINRLIGMRRELARFEGERGALDAQMARSGSTIAEIELQAVELDQRIVTEVSRLLREVDGQILEIAQRKVAADEQVRRTELRAPASGTVHELAVHTVGGVVRPGETVMSIVPKRDADFHRQGVAPRDIDQVRVGQRALLRFSALAREQTPEVPGVVAHVGADVSRDASTGRDYFMARIDVAPAAAATTASLPLTPGMPVDGFIETGRRTALSYLLKPLMDQFKLSLLE